MPRATKILSLVAALVVIGLAQTHSVSAAQDDEQLIRTDRPDKYFDQLMEDVEQEGAVVLKNIFKTMGLSGPQNDAAFSYLDNSAGENPQRWTDVIGSTEAGEAVQQYYGYAYLGKNAWIFIRVDFFRSSEREWVISNVIFNSSPDAVYSPAFPLINDDSRRRR